MSQKEMFKELDGRTVESSEGFKVAIRPMFNLYYIEGDHEARIFMEPSPVGDEPHGIAVATSRLSSWEPPFEDEQIDIAKRELISRRVAAALEFLNVRFVLE